MLSNTLVSRDHREVGSFSIPELCELAASGLVQMLDPDQQVFCHIYGRTETGMRRQGASPRYTLMTLLGLHRYELSGRRSPVAISPVLDRLRMDTSWVAGAGDLGLLLWTCAELLPGQVPQIYQQVKARDALHRFSDGQHGSTMEVAWYLTGLAACCLAGCRDLPGLTDQVATARAILERNCGPSGVYGHRSRSNSFAGSFRRRIGSFADQVYPTIALAKLSQALDDSTARASALRTAHAMCELQAPLGEWSWHYDSASGTVVSRYPVYSVHQHAMGPMMLFAAGEAGDCDFSEAIYRGLAWIGGNNELRRDFIEPSLGLIWRSIYLPTLKNYSDSALRILQLRRGAANVRLKVRYECRPYELGWLLYAFSDR